MEHMKNKDTNIILGYNINVNNYNNCILIGDNLTAIYDNDIVVGEKLYGKEINEDTVNMIFNHTEGLRFLLETLADELNNIMIKGVNIDV